MQAVKRGRHAIYIIQIDRLGFHLCSVKDILPGQPTRGGVLLRQGHGKRRREAHLEGRQAAFAHGRDEGRGEDVQAPAQERVAGDFSGLSGLESLPAFGGVR